MVGDHIYLNIGGIFSLKPFNLTGIAGGFLFISHSFDEPLLKQYNKMGQAELTPAPYLICIDLAMLEVYLLTAHCYI